METTIDTVIFDLGGVLVDVDHASAIDWLTARGCEFDAIEEFIARSGMLAHERGELSADSFLLQVNQLLREPESLPSLQQWWTGFLRPRDDMLALARNLRGRYRVFILSNTGPLHWQQAQQQFKLAELSDDALTSFEVGVAKPDPAIYTAAERRFSLRPRQTVFIDDLATNVSAAIAAGWHSLQYLDYATTRKGLSELGVNLAA